MKAQAITILAGALGLALTCGMARGDTKTWSGGSGDWFVDGNWSPGGIPQAGDDVVISTAGATVSLTNTVPASGSFNSLAISSTATLSFSNWVTELRATTVTVGNQATLTCAGPFTEAQMSNRVSIVCSNLTVLQGGKINVDGKGYAVGNGPGKGLAAAQGGGHGGQGHTDSGFPGGAPYGSAETPAHPGSGGFTGGGAGGGAIRIAALGHVVVNGTLTVPALSAKGLDTNPPGSGGSVWITCATFAGTNGVVSADGGNPSYSSGNGGGGGRIAVQYDTDAQALLPLPSVVFTACAGKRLNANHQYKFRGDLGTLWLPDTQWLGTTIPHSGRLVIPGFTSWTSPSLTVKGWIRFPGEGFALTVPGNVVVDGPHARLDIGEEQWANRSIFNHHCNPTAGPTLSVGGNLSLINNGHLSVHSGATNGVPRDYGALVEVAGTFSVGAYSWVIPTSHPTDGGSVLFRLKDLSIAKGVIVSDTGFNANGVGWPGMLNGAGYGFGAAPTKSHGAGHGGLGRTTAYAPSGNLYGSAARPLLPGSGGSGNSATVKGGNGGGVVRIEASGTVTLEGTIKANAKSDGMLQSQDPLAYDEDTVGRVGSDTAGGSGGSVCLLCRTITGAGAITAKGGMSTSSTSGTGGGGRIAVWFRNDTTSGAVTPDVSGGKDSRNPPNQADSGTVVWQNLPASGTMIQVR